MARYSVSARASSAATAIRGVSLTSDGDPGGSIREIGVTNTTTTAFCISIERITGLGAGGTALEEVKHNPLSGPAGLAAANHPTADHTVATDEEVARATIGAAAGAGYTWTFGDDGLVIPATANNGIALMCPDGTGQVFDFYIIWDE